MAYGTLLDASWGALGAEKSSIERLLAAPRGILREVSAILGVQNGVQEAAKAGLSEGSSIVQNAGSVSEGSHDC